MQMTFNVPNNLCRSTTAENLQPGMIYIDTDSADRATNVIVLRNKRIKNSESTRIIGIPMTGEPRIASFKLLGTRQMTVIGAVQAIHMTLDYKNVNFTDGADDDFVVDAP